MTKSKVEDNFPSNTDSSEIISTKMENIKNENVPPDQNNFSLNDNHEMTLINSEKLKDDGVKMDKTESTSDKMSEVFVKEFCEAEDKYKMRKKRGKTIYSCTFSGCENKYVRLHLLEAHLCMHTGERPFTCDYKDCDRAFTKRQHLKRHQLIHTQVIKPSYKCQFCAMEFTNQSNLKRHNKRLHDNPLSDYLINKTCKDCNLLLPTRKSLKLHLANEHGRQMYKCKFCIKTFSEPSVLARHMKSSVHKTYECEICSIRFTKYELSKHQKLEHKEIYPNYTCDICSKTISRKDNLKLHLREHEESNILTCEYEGCNRIYYFQRNLDLHIRTYHLGMKWECPHCKAGLCTKQKLLEHIDKIHENPVPRKKPTTKENRKKRKDAGKLKRSAVSQLVGIKLPMKTEKLILNRQKLK